MKRFALTTLGCRVNQYETQVIRENLLEMGFSEVPFDSESDVYVINTCAVTGESERKARQLIRRALRQKEKNSDCVICVCGCFSQGVKEEPLWDSVDLIVGNTDKKRVAELLFQMLQVPVKEREKLDIREDISKVREYECLSLSRSHNARAFLKIQDGCNSFCTYCFVPFVRGRVRSRPWKDVVSEAHRLVQNGYREIVLTGIETGSYGEDLTGGEDLTTLVERLSDVDGLERIRFGSLKPSIFTDAFCKALSSVEKVMPHFHLSLQSGSDDVLKRMGRKYTRCDEVAAAENIYRYFPDAGLSADLICGFPGETENDFLDSASLIRELGLLHTHIFPYSPRRGTRAAEMTDQIGQEVKRERAAHLLAVAKDSSVLFAQKRVGNEYRILCERIRDGFAFGYTENFIYTKTQIPPSVSVGEVFSARLTDERSFSVETMTVCGKSAKTVDNFQKKL